MTVKLEMEVEGELAASHVDCRDVGGSTELLRRPEGIAEFAGLEIAGLENDGRSLRGGK